MERNQLNIYTILDQLKVRKAMFLGNDFTFKSLDSFIAGFAMAASSKQLQTNGYPDFSNFSTWLLGHLNSHFGLGGGWCWQISNRHPKDDTGAFEEFFYFLDIFKRSLTHKKCIMVDKEAAEYSNRSGVRRAVFVNGKKALVNQSPSKIILTTIDNSTTVWLDFLDDYGDSVFADEWFINPDEAMKSLKREFGSFQNEWVVCDNVL
jgi:hypothetical protein